MYLLLTFLICFYLGSYGAKHYITIFGVPKSKAEISRQQQNGAKVRQDYFRTHAFP